MSCDFRKTLKTGTIPSPRDFRAVATGTGQSLEMSERSGAIRAQRVANSCDPQCAKLLPPSYPSPYPAEAGVKGSSRPASVRTTRPMPETETGFEDSMY